ISAPLAIISAAFSSSERITRAGAPTTRLLSGNVLPSVTTAPAPTIEFVPIRAPLRRIAPMPIRLPSPTVQPCSTTLCPITQPRPIVSGKPGSVCNVALSWIWERSPTSIHSLSPRNTAPHHTLASDLRRTRPITTAVSAIQYCPSAGNSGCWPASSNIGIITLLTGADTCHVAAGLARSGEQPSHRLEPHHQDGARHHAPEARRDGGQHDELDPPPLDAMPAQGVAHDDERGRKRQERHCHEGRRPGAAAQQAERGGAMGQELVGGRYHAGNRKAERHRQKRLDGFGGHLDLDVCT